MRRLCCAGGPRLSSARWQGHRSRAAEKFSAIARPAGGHAHE